MGANDMTGKAKTGTKKDSSSVIDGFANLTARMGYGADNLLSRGGYAPTNVTRNRQRLDAAYRTSWVVGVLVDSVAEDMTRAGIEITGSMEPESISTLQKAMTRRGLWSAYLELLKWSRLYGGAIGVINIDGQDLETPLDPETISKDSFLGMPIYDRWAVTPSTMELVKSGVSMGLPMFYTLNAAGGSIKVHYTRVIRSIGIQLPFEQAQMEDYWGESVVERVYDRLLAFDTATMGAANLIQKAHLRTVQVKDLRGILAAGNKAEENLIKMFSYMRLLQTGEGLTLLDSEDKFEAHSYTFSGLSDMILQFGQQVSGATGIPLVRLFGQSPAGLNSTGESDIRMYYDNIMSQQESRMRDGLSKLLDALYRSLFGTPPPDDFDFEFSPLWQTSEKEKTEIAKLNAETVSMALDSGIIDQKTALQELKQASAYTGVFSNITKEDIDEAEAEEPPDGESSVDPNFGASNIGSTVAEVSMNGAQVAAMVDIVGQVAQGLIPRDAGINMLIAAFPVTKAQAEQIMSTAGKSFKPEVVPSGKAF
jgi:uncharacterized protein